MERKVLNGEELLKAMNEHQTARWIALMEAIDVIDNYAKNKKIKFDDLTLKSNAIEDYVNHNSDIIYRKMTNKEVKGEKV